MGKTHYEDDRKTSMRLEDMTIVVTGASSGLGKAMADAFVEEGAQVVYSSHVKDRLSDAVEEIKESKTEAKAEAIRCDVRSWDDIRQLVRRTAEKYDKIDVFVNNAGVLQYKVNSDNASKTVEKVPVVSWDTILDTNLRGAFLCTKAVLPKMLSQDQGRVIHISSGHGVKGRAKRAPYVASKFGLEGFHESLALELTETNVDSITLRPPGGGVYTESSKLIGRTKDTYQNESPFVIAEAAVQLAAGEGENGGRYKATPDGDGYTEYSRSG